MQISVQFVKEKETKNTIRYQEVVDQGAAQVVGTLYVQKAALGNDVPEKVKLTIEEAA